ncbi:MAG: hypothetical protein LBB50_06040 [Oscillospiraceae bacterium]|jgi:glycerophosphoryl diester phosphodiesterase|nr:hypothetical protein [Oscillospiraceae bacterium]
MALVISHRGANRFAPENTLPAFEKSLALHVDGFENDVHLTKDGLLVVCHDETVDRTSNGTGRICDHTLAELRALDFGGWFSAEFAGTKIPTIEEFFALCDPLRVVNVEIKEAADGTTESAAAVVRIAKQMGVFHKLIISSFDMNTLQACLRADSSTRICYLYAPATSLCEEIVDDPIAVAKQYHLYAYHPMVGMVTRDYIEECHDAGIVVNPWTVNQEHAIAALKDWNSDGVITDCPDLAMQIMYGA